MIVHGHNKRATWILCCVEYESVEIPEYLHTDIYPCAIRRELHGLLHKQPCTNACQRRSQNNRATRTLD